MTKIEDEAEETHIQPVSPAPETFNRYINKYNIGQVTCILTSHMARHARPPPLTGHSLAPEVP